MMDDKEELKQDALQRAISLLVTILLILSVALCAYVTVQVLSDGYVNIGGFMMFRVVTGSMEPQIPVGSLLLCQDTEIDAVEVDDIVCFYSQEGQLQGKVITHRVTYILTGADGQLLLETKGDANAVAAE